MAYANDTGILVEPSGKRVDSFERAGELLDALTYTYGSKKTFCALPELEAQMLYWLEVNRHQKLTI